MARDHARFYVSIWSDQDFIALSALAKIVYVQLCTQQKLTYAGALDVSVKRWTRAYPDQNTDAVRAALAELDAARFIVVDHDTEELLVRSFIRRDGLYKQPNVLRAALRCAFEIESPLLRRALAVELRRLPVEITGPAPAVAATELEADARELPGSVKAAMSVRGSTRTTHTTAPAEPDEQAVTEPVVNEVTNPSANRSPQAQGEGSRERETGVVPLTLRETKVGVPARTPASADTHPRTRESGPAAEVADAGTDAFLEASSVRQLRRREAERLVSLHCPRQPKRVLDRLRGEVIGLLRDEVEPPVIAAGLRLWAGKQLAVSFLPELVGEVMRAHATSATPEARRRELTTAAHFEAIRADAIADDDTTPIGRAVRGELPEHADAATLDAILERALNEAAGLVVAA